jgi:hypothetical protein
MNTNTFPPFEAFPQGIDFLKQFWAQGAASANSPASNATPAFQQAMGQYMMPTLDVDELDKRIGDMRTVLQFMEMNTNVLRQSLNALEVQRSTIAALHAMAKPQDAHANPTTDTPSWLAAWQNMMKPTAVDAGSPKPAAKKVVTKKTASKKTK